MPHVFIKWLTEPGDVIYDPFSGRGTTALEACLMARRGLCSDLNPLAVVLSGAKVDPPSGTALKRRLRELSDAMEPEAVEGQPSILRTVFSTDTLGQLLWLRHELDSTKRVDRFLLAALAGILHLNAEKSGRPRGLSVSMPNTFSMSPGYVEKYVSEHGLVAPEVDVLAALGRRINQLDPFLSLPIHGDCWTEDAAGDDIRYRRKKAKLIFTSPPYLHVMKYGKFNWLRLWLLGESPTEVDAGLMSTQSLPRYLSFMSEVLQHLVGRLSPDGYLCLVIGDVADGDKTIRLAEHVKECGQGLALQHAVTLVDDLPHIHKVSRIWGERKGRATRTDRILVFAGSEARRLPPVPQLDWQKAP
jgi:site-specific DNA-methyltransferase (adenine-specific)